MDEVTGHPASLVPSSQGAGLTQPDLAEMTMKGTGYPRVHPRVPPDMTGEPPDLPGDPYQPPNRIHAGGDGSGFTAGTWTDPGGTAA